MYICGHICFLGLVIIPPIYSHIHVEQFDNNPASKLDEEKTIQGNRLFCKLYKIYAYNYFVSP